MKEKYSEKSSLIAGRSFENEDYKKESQLSSGLATTHEQVSDTLTEGEINAVIDDVNGQDIEIPRKGYE